MKITISGKVGSGKSTVAKLLAKKLSLEYYSIGTIMREMASERGLSINEFSKKAENDKSIDIELDTRQKEIGKKEKFIMDSRLGFYFIPDSFKIFLDVDIKEAAKRIYSDSRKEESFEDINKAAIALKERIDSEKKRYKEYYGINFPELKRFDLVIDTTSKKPEEAVLEIVKRIKAK